MSTPLSRILLALIAVLVIAAASVGPQALEQTGAPLGNTLHLDAGI